MTATHHTNTTTGSESSNAMGRKKKALQIVHSHERTMGKLLQENSRRHRLHKVFSDFCELAALALSNTVDLVHREEREARYMQIVGQYEREEVQRFPQLLAVLVDWLECGLDDCLGKLFMGLDLGDAFKGQFFTSFGTIQRRGFALVNEPACGAGGMLLAAADALQTQGINYQQTMHATGVDVDATAVHMAYVQLSLAHVPAIVVHGNSLSLAEWGYWFTPAHILGGWDTRLRVGRDKEAGAAGGTVPELPTIVPMQLDLAEVRTVALTQRAERLQLDLF